MDVKNTMENKREKLGALTAFEYCKSTPFSYVLFRLQVANAVSCPISHLLATLLDFKYSGSFCGNPDIKGLSAFIP